MATNARTLPMEVSPQIGVRVLPGVIPLPVRTWAYPGPELLGAGGVAGGVAGRGAAIVFGVEVAKDRPPPQQAPMIVTL